MNDLMIFNSNEFGQVRTLEMEGKIYFVGKDVASALDYKEPHKAIARHCKGGIKHPIPTKGGKQEMLVIPEGDVYRLIVHSKLPNAEKFESWVFDEVLPQIRKTGYYIPNQMSPMELLKLQYQVLEEHDKELKEMKKDFNEYKENSPLFTIECKQLQSQVRKTAIQVLGGYGSPAYKDNSLRQKVFSDIQRELKRQFDVTRYEAIKRSEYEEAIEIIKNYVTTKKLKDDIKLKNSQIYIKIEG